MVKSGYTQVICKNGHYHEVIFSTINTEDISYFSPEKGIFPEHQTGFPSDQNLSWRCPICGVSALWYNRVDTTWGEWEDGARIDGYVDLYRYKICKVLEGIKKITSKYFGINIFYVDKYKIPATL